MLAHAMITIIDDDISCRAALFRCWLDASAGCSRRRSIYRRQLEHISQAAATVMLIPRQKPASPILSVQSALIAYYDAEKAISPRNFDGGLSPSYIILSPPDIIEYIAKYHDAHARQYILLK